MGVRKFLFLGIMLFILIPAPYGQADSTPPPNSHAALGEVFLPKGAAQTGDFLIVVFSKNLDAQAVQSLGSLQLQPQQLSFYGGCHSVARLDLQSGQPQLDAPGKLSFSCRNVPEGAAIYGYIGSQWRKLDSLVTDKTISASFRHLTTYAIFFPKAPPPHVAHGQI